MFLYATWEFFMEKDFKTLQELYNKLTTLSNDWELDTFKLWKGKTGEDYITCRFTKKKPEQISVEDVKGIVI
jgi:hypothetical protein